MIEWINKEVTHRGEANEILARLYKHIKYNKVTAAAFDTETTGLHPVFCINVVGIVKNLIKALLLL